MSKTGVSVAVTAPDTKSIAAIPAITEVAVFSNHTPIMTLLLSLLNDDEDDDDDDDDDDEVGE